jgi:subtilisin family serine protease
LKEHTNGVVGLLAELAPTAVIRVFPVLGDTKAAVSPLDVTTAMESAVMEGAQVLLVPLGFPGGLDMTIRAVVKFAIARGIFVVWPAGNEGKAIERRHTDQGAVYVGAVENDNRALYSNYGTGVTLFAPGSVLTYTTPTAYGESTGTSYSATIVAAAAANLIAASPMPPSPVDLEAQLVRQTRERDGMRILSLSAP